MKIAIIGTGNLGLSIAKGLVINNAITTLHLTKRNPDSLSDWNKTKNVTVTSDNKEAVKQADILIFAVQQSIRGNFSRNKRHTYREACHYFDHNRI